MIVGGGAGGVELALAMEHRLRRLADDRPAFDDRLCLVTRRDIVPSFPRRGREMLREELKRRGIAVFTGTEIVEARPGSLLCADGATLPFDEAVWVTGAAAPPWLRDSGLALDEKGFVALHPTLRSINDPHVFAAGDVATVLEHPRPKAGVFAVRQGGPLAGNLRRALRGEPLRSLHAADALPRPPRHVRGRSGRDARRLGGEGRLGMAAETMDRPPLDPPISGCPVMSRLRAPGPSRAALLYRRRALMPLWRMRSHRCPA